MRLTVTVPDTVADHARDLAMQTGRSVSAIVADAVERYVAETRRRHAFDSVEAIIGTGSGDAAEFDRALDEIRQDAD